MNETIKTYVDRIYASLGKPVPPEIYARIERINSFVQIAKGGIFGELQSSQVVAVVIEEYERNEAKNNQ